MDYYKAVKRGAFWRIWLGLLLLAAAVAGVWFLAAKTTIPIAISAAACAVFVLSLSLIVALVLTQSVLAPLKMLQQAILHVSSSASDVPAPNIETLRLGRQLVAALVMQIYEMASKQHQQTAGSQATAERDLNRIVELSPIPMLATAPGGSLYYANEAAMEYLGLSGKPLSAYIGKNINDILPLSFPSEHTYESWLKDRQTNAVHAVNTWDRTRIIDNNGNPVKQFDLAASYNKGGAVETVLTLFDHTKQYSADDTQVSFVAMAVHELRTPLTIMRGYIEVFEDELGPSLSPELKDFMHKMHASAQQLTAFVSNILNVARVEENQLMLTLRKEDINEILTKAVDDLELRARVHAKHIELQLAADLPPVAADRISIHEVINNLVDNAIKYGGKSDKIIITSRLGSNNMVEVLVQDFGNGIPAGLVPKLFTRFYRSHRSSGQASGTGLGLYICKAIISAHGGDIGVHTKEGEGSTFTFTLEIYDAARHATEEGQNGIMRGAHGWIKNHSLYRS